MEDDDNVHEQEGVMGVPVTSATKLAHETLSRGEVCRTADLLLEVQSIPEG